MIVGFDTRPVVGYGYSGLARYYDLIQTTNLFSGDWSPVPGFSGALGFGQSVSVTNTVRTPQQFFRGQVRLQPVSP